MLKAKINVVEEFKKRDIFNLRQEQWGRIDKSTYLQNYLEIYTGQELPKYLQKPGRAHQMIARFRIGNEERGNMYWSVAEKRQCRLCGYTRETIEHMTQCPAMGETENRNRRDLLSETGDGKDWMRKVLEVRKRKEVQ